MHTFDGMEIGTVTSWEDSFTEEYNDDGQLTLLSKKTFHHEEPELDFNYRYVITAVDMCRAAGEGSIVWIQLYLVPEPKDWCRESLLKAAASYGLEKEPEDRIREAMKPQDAIENGYGVLFGRDSVDYGPDNDGEGLYDVLENKDVLKKVNAAASAVAFYDGTRGFALDRCQNRIGSTGWDTLNECLHGKDKIQAGLERLKKQEEV